MKPKTMILMVVAVVCGLGASYMTSRLLAERNSEPVETPKVAVLVAKKNLEQGTALKEKLAQELFEEKYFLKGEEPKDALTSIDQLKDKFVKHSLRKGDFVTNNDIVEEQMSIDLPKGMLGLGLRVNIEGQASGFASLPGQRVNIYVTVRRATDDESACFLLLEEVLVLAADQQVGKNDKGAMPAGVVTVALSPDDVPKVNLAKDLGTLTLAVRHLGDKLAKTEKGKFTVSDLMRKHTGRPGEITNGNPNDNESKGGTSISPQPAKQETVKKDMPSPTPTSPTPGSPLVQSLPNTDKPAPLGPPPTPLLQPYVAFVTVGDKTVTKTYFLDDNGEVVVGATDAKGPAPGTQPQQGPVGPGASGPGFFPGMGPPANGGASKNGPAPK